MSTIVITGGTDGLGRALAADRLRAGHTVVVVGRSEAKFRELPGDAHFIQADLREVSENFRATQEIAERFPVVDTLVLGAAYVHRDRQLTGEGFEHTFALYYLSRHVFASELQGVLGAAERPLILDTTVPGAPKDAIRWDDFQLSSGFTWKAANLQSRRMGLLSASRLASEHVRYVLYNPGFVRTSHQGALGRTSRALVGVLAKLLGTPTEKAILPMLDLIRNRPEAPLSAYQRDKRLTIDEVDLDEAERLHAATRRLLRGAASADQG
ncbi:SDR family NAD(P)-dependent oxidoreductase [Amycolatopsis umgeniensis]|uniref:NAD(P)-dependent dehydrogenase (Short-subunit alcohol dehydrogenase family) n=1 Tax=Amycolatopsis umgeniensis TaxID=336628 RepID=A0A841B3W2_9PSEU|nr:SDR family NAD(P)-dependent oxidoreductase [Amycolatopsis umgeniensis]MBB5853078.1 NAD(P)-dependent dehydrogenase (short-subunit alcohol dehydrogenase family) [Amycolatopsis umgeniensis]